MSKVLIAGYGSAGQYLTDFILKDHRINVDEIHIMSRKSNKEVEPRLDISRVASGISERFIPLIYHQADFDDIDAMSTIIEEVKPNIIVYTGRFASGIKYGAFSYPHDIGYGVWMPLAVPYIYNLMRAVKKTSVDPKVINTSFPDGTNYLLDGAGLAPTCGAGNLNHLIPRIKRAIVENTPEIKSVKDIQVRLVGSHYLNTYVSKEGTSRGCPSYLTVQYDSSRYLLNEDQLNRLYSKCKDNSASGQIRNQMIASDCAELVRLMTSDFNFESTRFIHIPGINGYPGGYPALVDFRGSIQLDLKNVTFDQAVKANIEGLQRDGVVIEGSRIRFTDDVRSKMESIYSISYPLYLDIEDCEDFAKEISCKLNSK